MARANPNILLAEGDDEKRVIPFLLDKYVVWGDSADQWVVEIKSYGGIDDLLEPGNIHAAAKTTGRKAVGVVLDANDQFESRWLRVRKCCIGIANALPESLPSAGLIHQNADGLRIGVWIMPDNQSRGMLETFLSNLVRAEHSALWAFATEACASSRAHGAPYRDSHRDKADVHTFLAWLDPPGQSLHLSVLTEALDARSPLGEQFARWFIDLYQLTPRLPVRP